MLEIRNFSFTSLIVTSRLWTHVLVTCHINNVVNRTHAIAIAVKPGALVVVGVETGPVICWPTQRHTAIYVIT